MHKNKSKLPVISLPVSVNKLPVESVSSIFSLKGISLKKEI